MKPGAKSLSRERKEKGGKARSRVQGSSLNPPPRGEKAEHRQALALPGIFEKVQMRRREYLEGLGHLKTLSGSVLICFCREISADHLQASPGKLALMF